MNNSGLVLYCDTTPGRKLQRYAQLQDDRIYPKLLFVVVQEVLQIWKVHYYSVVIPVQTALHIWNLRND